MSYKLLVVEDEDTIRESLINFINWESMGFEVDEGVPDGQDAIEYIKCNQVDVVLTDIKMAFVSGLELAKYIHKNYKDILVVILTGYKDFDFAKKAIKYNVSDYILKPIKVDEIENTFDNIKKNLDKRKNKRKRNKHYNELLPLMIEQFFTDLMFGVLNDKEKINKKIKLLGLGIDPAISKCGIYQIKCDISKDIEIQSNFGNEEIYLSIYQFIKGKENEISYFPIRKGNNKIYVCALSVKSENVMNEIISNYFHKKSEQIKSILNIQIEYSHIYTYNNIFHLASQSVISARIDKEYLSSSRYEKLQEQSKIFMSYLNKEDFDALNNLISKIIFQFKMIDIEYAKNFIIDLFSMISNNLKESKIYLEVETNGEFSYKKILEMNDLDEINVWCKEMLKKIKNYYSNYKNKHQIDMIKTAKNYIKKNYYQDITLEGVADKVYLSPVYFSRLFKEETGERFIDYLIKIRLEKAKNLLKNSELKVYQISEKIGYKSSKYFSRLFKESTGVTPSEFRRCAKG